MTKPSSCLAVGWQTRDSNRSSCWSAGTGREEGAAGPATREAGGLCPQGWTRSSTGTSPALSREQVTCGGPFQAMFCDFGCAIVCYVSARLLSALL